MGALPSGAEEKNHAAYSSQLSRYGMSDEEVSIHQGMRKPHFAAVDQAIAGALQYSKEWR